MRRQLVQPQGIPARRPVRQRFVRASTASRHQLRPAALLDFRVRNCGRTPELRRNVVNNVLPRGRGTTHRLRCVSTGLLFGGRWRAASRRYAAIHD